MPTFNEEFLRRAARLRERRSHLPPPEPLELGTDGMVSIPGSKLRIIPQWAEAMGYQVKREGQNGG